MVIEGMAVEYIPYRIVEEKKEVNHRYITIGITIVDGEIIFCPDGGSKGSDWIKLKYPCCPKGKDVGEFPVLLIKVDNGEEFAVTNWAKIRNNSDYAHIRPFMSDQ